MIDVLHAVFGGWSAEPVPLVAAAAAVLVYAAGSRRLGAARSPLAPTHTQTACLAAGVALILVALLSPIDELALRLQWVHMVQHVILLVAAPPLVVLARPWRTATAAFETRRCLPRLLAIPASVVATHGRRVGTSIAAVALFTGVLWLWHIPALYDLTLRNDAVHNLEHTAFLAVGLLFWAAALPRDDAEAALGMLGRAVVVAGGLVGSWLLAVYIGYAPAVLYAYSGSGGLSATADQQIAAGAMWVPASAPFIAVLVWLGARWLENDARAAAAEAAVRSEAHA